MNTMKKNLSMGNGNSDSITGSSIALCCLYSLLLVLLINVHGWVADERPQPSLTDIVLFNSFPLSSLSPASYGDNPWDCVKGYVTAAKPSLSKEPASGRAEQIITVRRWRLERHMIVIHGQTAKREAELFAAGVPLSLEWEGMSEGPLLEADYAEQWLNRYPQSPMVPFLHLFAAHRFRAGFEAAGREHAKGLIPITATQYRQHLQAARSAGNNWISCIAKEMEALPYVYLPDFGRP
jgi:hypothetical protein